jgi:hypothetical protein
MTFEDDFIIETDDKYICFNPYKRDLWGNNHRDNTENNINVLELSYRQEDKDGWGAGGGEYITTQDISEISHGIQRVLKKESNQFTYSCLDEIIKICIDVKTNGLLDFTFSMIETLFREYYITITMNNLAFEEFAEKTKIFIEWEKQFPTLEKSWLSLYHATFDKIFQHDCHNDTRCEADFNIKVDDLLENNPYGFGDFLIRLLTYFEENTNIDSKSLTNYINAL